MEQFTYITLLNDARKAIAEQRLSDALHAIGQLLAERPDWEVSERLLSIEQAYQQMLTFMQQGGIDLERERLYNKFLQQASELVNILLHRHLIEQKGTYYCTVAKTLQAMKVPVTVAESISKSLSGQTLFERIYTSGQWSEKDRQTVLEAMAQGEEAPQAMILSGITLALLTNFDPCKAGLLLLYSVATVPVVRVRALVGVVLSYIKDEKQWQLYPELIDGLNKYLQEEALSTRKIQQLQLQMFITSESRKIQKQMREEILPSIMKTAEELRKQQGNGEQNFSEELSKLTANPEWERDGRLSEISDSMRKIQEYQQQGADVYIGAFSSMKDSIPFFNAAANWFFPFILDNLDLEKEKDDLELCKALERSPMFCNSDKYSMIFFFRTMPEKQRRMIQQQFAMSLNADDLQTKEDLFSRELRIYLQDLYRFFTLFNLPEREAVNPFRHDLLLTEREVFKKALDNKIVLMELADFQFKQKNFELSTLLFQRASAFEQTDAIQATELFGKWGYACQMLNDTEGAIFAYEKVLLFSPEDVWTLTALSNCYQRANRFDDALRTSQVLLSLDADNVQNLMLVALIYMRQGEYEQAHGLLLKAVYLDPQANAAQSALAWCELSLQHPENALKQYQKLLSQSKVPSDLMNAGHAAWLSGQVVMAMTYYKEFLQQSPNTTLSAELFHEDEQLLQKGGINKLEQMMMIDLLRNS